MNVSLESSIGVEHELLTSTVGVAKGDNSACHSGTAGSVGAITNTIAKVDVLAEACSIGARASQGWGKVEHVVDAGLLLKGEMLAIERQQTCRERWDV